MPDLRVSFPVPCDEPWEAMAPLGRGRMCDRCDKVVHDLSRYELGDAEALIRANPATCFRARVGADGAVALSPGRHQSARRMVIAAAATAGLLAVAPPAFATTERPGGAIAGDVSAFGVRVRVIATSSDGRKFRTKVKNGRRFRIGNVPPGTYRLSFVPDCGERWTVDNVVVGDGETVVPASENESVCIVIGMLRIEDGGRR